MAKVIERHYAPRGAAREVFARREPEVLIAGPAGTGKSRACLEKLHAMALLNPNMRALVVRKTHVSLTSTGLQTFRQHVIPEAESAGIVKWYGGSAERPAGYIYDNGSFVAISGMDRPSKIMSSEYDLIFVQEATELNLDDWESLKSRLRNGAVSFQQILADCNPQGPTHWLKLRCDAGTCVLLSSRHEDNPILFDDNGNATVRGTDYLALLDNLTGVRKPRLRYGQWVAAEGVIYEDWNERKHVVDKRPHGSNSWQRYWSIDFGYVNPFVWQEWAVDDDGCLWLMRELYKTKTLVEDHARHILSLVTNKDGTWNVPKPTAVICDHDAEDRATLERHLDMGTIPARKSVSDGIQAMAVRLRDQPPRQQPRLMVYRGASVERDPLLAQAGKPLGFIGEVTGYVWLPGPDGKAGKEEPAKIDDHAMDAARYMVSHLDLVGRPNVRWI